MEHFRLMNHGNSPIQIVTQPATKRQDKSMLSVHSGVTMIFAGKEQSDILLLKEDLPLKVTEL